MCNFTSDIVAVQNQIQAQFARFNRATDKNNWHEARSALRVILEESANAEKLLTQQLERS